MDASFLGMLDHYLHAKHSTSSPFDLPSEPGMGLQVPTFQSHVMFPRQPAPRHFAKSIHYHKLNCGGKSLF